MKKLLILAALLALPACKALGEVNWPKVAQCGPDVGDVVGAVSRVLLGKGDVVTELTDLARTHGTDTVVCLVDHLRADWSSPGASATPERVRGVARADVFLDEIGTDIQRSE